MFQQVTQEGNLGHKQKEDDRLRHCWGQVRLIDGTDQQPGQHLPVTYFLVSNGLFYFWLEHRGQLCDLLIIPRTKILPPMHLAHSHPLSSHLGTHNTLVKLWDWFLWPRMDAEIWAFCEQCLQCQRTAPWKPPPTPFIPRPIIGIPFEKVGMDLVGPLPKSARGHKYILVIVPY